MVRIRLRICRQHEDLRLCQLSTAVTMEDLLGCESVKSDRS
jgi:hypothetical protein